MDHSDPRQRSGNRLQPVTPFPTGLTVPLDILGVVPKSPTIHVYPARTRRRFAELQRYVEDKLLREGKFICGHYEACEASKRASHDFLEGTMSHVGRRFDLRRGDKPLRVVVVGQEAADRLVTLEDRRMPQVPESRYYKEKGHEHRNPHMRGTTSALRVIFGKGLEADYEGEWVYPVNGKKFHIYDGFALVNRLLCFAGPPNSRQGRGTRTMVSNCGVHLTETLSILEPTILILQGDKAATTWNILTPGRSYTPYLNEAHLGQQRVLVCSFSHPSARGELRWGDRLDAPYLLNTVVPTLREALRRS